MHKLKTFKGLKGKMFGLLVFPIIAVLIVSGVNLTGINRLVEDLSIANGDLIPGFRSFHKITYYTSNMNQKMLLALQTTSKEERQVWQKEIVKDLELLKKEVVHFDEKHELNDEEKKIYVPLLEGRDAYYKTIDEVMSLLENTDPSKSLEAMAIIKEKLLPYSKSLMIYLDGLSDGHEIEAVELYEQAEADSIFFRRVSMIASLLGILLSIFLGIIISRKFIGIITQNLEALSVSSETVNAATESIANTSTQLKTVSADQSSSLQETTSSMEEISMMVQKNAETANTTAQISLNSQKSAMRGKDVVQEMKEAIRQIADDNSLVVKRVNDSNSNMTQIAGLIADIGAKTKIINEIVFQTKLLSFNASVEAARAGEQGKGFAVVAEEVGNLAQMSGNAAQEISAMLDNSIQKVNDIVSTTKSQVDVLVVESKRKIEIGVKVAEECDLVLSEIVDNVNQMTSMANEIAVSSKEQAMGVLGINKAINQLDLLNQQNSDAAARTSSNSEVLAGQVSSLQKVVNELAATVHGESD